MQKQTEYNDAIRIKFPEQVVIVIAKDAAGKYNPITLGWCMNTSFEPPMLAFSVGKTRHTLEAVRASRECVIAFPSEAQADEALFYGTKSGRDMDKIKTFGGKTLSATEIDGVLLEDAVANFECRIKDEMVTGSHVLFTAKVLVAHVNTESKDRVYQVEGGHALRGVKAKDNCR